MDAPSLQRIGLITKLADQRAMESAGRLAEWLHARGREVAVTHETAAYLRLPEEVAQRRKPEEVPEGQDLVVVIGGDGTFIGAARTVGGGAVPLLGINMGRLGFLTEIPRHVMIPTLEKVLAGHYRIEERMTLETTVWREGGVALRQRVINDVVVHKWELARMIEFEVSVDGQFVFSSRADGLIASTPTGSTAYALSAGGPIMHPSLEAMLLVPICPHTLSNRPIAIPGSGVVEIGLVPDNLSRQVTLDGQTAFPLADGDRITIQRSPHPLKVLHLTERNYYDILRQKLRWGVHAGPERHEGSFPGANP
ncbi:MAG: NAD(+) kinase [Magnetococcales bacterium]|nr:NAD(+) kinase [Magnetococcales bacterium]